MAVGHVSAYALFYQHLVRTLLIAFSTGCFLPFRSCAPDVNNIQYGCFFLGNLLIQTSPDFENQSQYDLIVNASDNGKPPKSALAPVKVTIEDVNDHEPAFNQSSYSFTVSEGAALQGRVGAVYATDLDSGPRGRVVYSITGGNVGKAFAIDGNSGQCYLIAVHRIENSQSSLHEVFSD